MVGLGTQDDLTQAKEFVADTGVRHQMVWDASGASWTYFKIPIQPASALVAPDGRTLATFKTGIELEKVLALVENG